MGLISELRRRNVLRMAVLYAVAAWLIMQVAEVLVTLAHLPHWIGPTIIWLLAIGFPISLIFSWFYEITPEGISLEKDVDRSDSITHVTGRRLDFLVISLLCAAVILFAYDKWWISGPPEKSIAVLAFENMSDDPGQEYFSDGISEELLNLLAQIPELRVISRSSAFSFKGKDIAIPTMAEQLNVAHVLEGSVRRDGNRVRITAQLIEARSDSHLWSQSYDRELDDIFAVQAEIARAILDVLKVKLALVEGVAKQPTVIKAANADAYDAYLRGRELLRLRGGKNLEDAVHHLGRSLRLDNDFAPAHAQLAIAMILSASTAEEAMRTTVIQHLDRAHELEPDLAEAHGGRALLARFTVDLESSIEHAQKALASNPSYVDALNWLHMTYTDLGRYEEARATLKRLLVTDPLSIIGRYNYAEWLSLAGRDEEAHELADQLLAESPRMAYYSHVETSFLREGKIAEGLSWALKLGRDMGRGTGYAMHMFICVSEYGEARRMAGNQTFWVDVSEGRFEEAIQATQRNMDLYPDNQNVIASVAYVLYLAGRIDEALPIYERLVDFVPDGQPIPGYLPVSQTMRLALARRKGGDEAAAQAAAQIARRDLAVRRAAGWRDQKQDQAEAMIAAFEHDPDRAIAALKSAIRHGLRTSQFFDDLMFEDLWDEPRFVALQKELNAILVAEHEKVLQLICFDNPVPGDWQPMPETCERVVEKLVL